MTDLKPHVPGLPRVLHTGASTRFVQIAREVVVLENMHKDAMGQIGWTAQRVDLPMAVVFALIEMRDSLDGYKLFGTFMGVPLYAGPSAKPDEIERLTKMLSDALGLRSSGG